MCSLHYCLCDGCCLGRSAVSPGTTVRRAHLAPLHHIISVHSDVCLIHLFPVSVCLQSVSLWSKINCGVEKSLLMIKAIHGFWVLKDKDGCLAVLKDTFVTLGYYHDVVSVVQ